MPTRRMTGFGWTAVLSAACLAALPARAALQMFPTKSPARGLSAFLVGPTEGLDGAAPAGWKRITSDGFGNSALAGECLSPEAADAAVTTASYALPRSDYVVSVLVRGEGRARLAGSAEWTPLKTPRGNYYAWVEIGTVRDADRVRVEVAATGTRAFFYAGFLAEGQSLPVIPVAGVTARIRAGGPATVVLLGDSVTENSGGTGGGSSRFETGNPGRMLAFLQELGGGPVDYLAHREPPAWKGIPRKENPGALPTAEIGGKTVYEARQSLDPARKVHLVNLGKGGAASDWGWSRMPDTIVEYDYFDTALPEAERRNTVRHGLAHYRPDLVIVNFGTNDCNGAHPAWTVEDYLFHMKILACNLQRQFGAAVILATPHKWNSGTHLFPHRQGRMVAALRAFCRQTGLALADAYQEYAIDAGDGIHPRDAGHGHLAAAYVKAMLGQPSAPATRARIAAADLADNGDGTVTDRTTRLQWMAAPLPPVSADALADAVAKANAERVAGRDGWRLPTMAELYGLVDLERSDPALPAGHPFRDVADFVPSGEKSWGVDMTTGIGYAATGKAADRVVRPWLVRSP